jgi:hypothetical protein
MHLTILGKRWRYRTVRRIGDKKTTLGQCDPPDKKNKEIRVLSRLSGESRMDVVIHEMLHAAGWHLDEEFVDRFATDAARALTKMGYTDGKDNGG